MSAFNINGIEVDFPKEPYKCQVDYMQKIIETLSTSSNALLESPTGTGKTLSLLCSSLAWQLHQRKGIQNTIQRDTQINIKIGLSAPKKSASQYTIIYASRTHSQLAQVVGELRSTSYHPKVAVLGSREQLCIHDKISKLSSHALNHSCTNLTNKRACSYQNNLDDYLGHTEGVGNAASPIYDIEDLVRLGHQDKICPYFYSRNYSEKADIIFLPYNYLLDTSIRGTLKLDWNDSIIIFDEAHNIEKIASDASSFTLTSSDIATCIHELQTILKYLVTHADTLNDTNKSSEIQDKNSQNKGKFSITSSSSGGSHNSNSNDDNVPIMQNVAQLLKSLFSIEQQIDSVPLMKGHVGETTSNVLKGDWLVMLFESAGLSFHQSTKWLQEIKRCTDFLLLQAQDNNDPWTRTSFSSPGGTSTTSVPQEPKLILLSKAISRLYKGNTLQEAIYHSKDYKVFLYEDISSNLSKLKPSEQFAVSLSNMTTGGAIKKRVLNYWAFSPGIAMEELKKLGVRSIILTSGTLSPLDSLREDLKIPFTIELINPHVIENHQIYVGALSTGPQGKVLNSSYNMRNKNDYKDELGLSILTIIQSCHPSQATHYLLNNTYNNSNVNNNNSSNSTNNKIAFNQYHVNTNTKSSGIQNNHMTSSSSVSSVSGDEVCPILKGGILVFFPSYSVMEQTVSRWKESGMYEKLKHAGSAIVMEPKTKTTTTSSSSNNGNITTSSSSSHSSNSGRNNNKFNANKSSYSHVTSNVSKNKLSTISATATTTKAKISFFTSSNSNKNSTNNPQQINDDENEGDEWNTNKSNLGALITEFDDALRQYGSCLLFAVCRGKVSEGIDFSNNRGRIVIITGLPYAPFQDPWVILKKQFLDEQCTIQQQQHQQQISSTSNISTKTMIQYQPASNNNNTSGCSYNTNNNAYSGYGSTININMNMNVGLQRSINNGYGPIIGNNPYNPITHTNNTMKIQSSSSSSSSNIRRLNGNGWYLQSASRAVNQAIGRVIRHKYDWGAIFLLDERFQKDQQISQLSGWVKPTFTSYTTFTPAISSFRQFATNALKNPLLNPTKKIKVEDTRRIPPLISSKNTTNNDSVIQKEVLLSQSVFKKMDTEYQSYIPPEYLNNGLNQNKGKTTTTTTTSISTTDSNNLSQPYMSSSALLSQSMTTAAAAATTIVVDEEDEDMNNDPLEYMMKIVQTSSSSSSSSNTQNQIDKEASKEVEVESKPMRANSSIAYLFQPKSSSISNSVDKTHKINKSSTLVKPKPTDMSDKMIKQPVSSRAVITIDDDDDDDNYEEASNNWYECNDENTDIQDDTNILSSQKLTQTSQPLTQSSQILLSQSTIQPKLIQSGSWSKPSRPTITSTTHIKNEEMTVLHNIKQGTTATATATATTTTINNSDNSSNDNIINSNTTNETIIKKETINEVICLDDSLTSIDNGNNTILSSIKESTSEIDIAVDFVTLLHTQLYKIGDILSVTDKDRIVKKLLEIFHPTMMDKIDTNYKTELICDSAIGILESYLPNDTIEECLLTLHIHPKLSDIQKMYYKIYMKNCLRYITCVDAEKKKLATASPATTMSTALTTTKSINGQSSSSSSSSNSNSNSNGSYNTTSNSNSNTNCSTSNSQVTNISTDTRKSTSIKSDDKTSNTTAKINNNLTTATFLLGTKRKSTAVDNYLTVLDNALKKLTPFLSEEDRTRLPNKLNSILHPDFLPKVNTNFQMEVICDTLLNILQAYLPNITIEQLLLSLECNPKLTAALKIYYRTYLMNRFKRLSAAAVAKSTPSSLSSDSCSYSQVNASNSASTTSSSNSSSSNSQLDSNIPSTTKSTYGIIRSKHNSNISNTNSTTSSSSSSNAMNEEESENLPMNPMNKKLKIWKPSNRATQLIALSQENISTQLKKQNELSTTTTSNMTTTASNMTTTASSMSSCNNGLKSSLANNKSSKSSSSSSSLSSSRTNNGNMDSNTLFTNIINNTKLNTTTTNANKALLQLICGICGEKSQIPCAAPCGHICCSPCWIKWLRIKEICPTCRQHTTVNSLSKLKMKR